MKSQRLYLHDILERIRMVEEFTAGGRAEFMGAVLIQEGVIRCFEVIGEATKRLSPELTADYPNIPWRQITGFRDILIHNYDETDVDVVWKVVAEDLAPLKSAVERMLQRLDEADTNEGAP